MIGKLGGAGVVFTVLALALAFEPSARAQVSPARPMITAPILESNLVPLPGNVRPEANAANDLGRVPDTLPMEHMLLQLHRPAAQEQALKQLIDQLHDPNSANYRRWLTPSQFGAQFGPAASDIQQVSGWLKSHGFSVNATYPSGMTIDFSGNAGQVFAAFHTEIHSLQVKGATHFANMSNPQIPAALAPAVVGVVSLHDFAPPRSAKAQSSVKPQLSQSIQGIKQPLSVGGFYMVTPPDLATIYNFNPVFTSGTTGQNQTIYLIEDSDVFATSDWTTFRSTFGIPVSSYPGASLTMIHPAPPSGGTPCTAPGVGADDGHATLTAEYASAAAPSAAIVIASCAFTAGVDGFLTALQNLINGANPPAIIGLGYAVCEASNGATSNAAYNAIYQQGVAQGASIFVATGDDLAGVCDGDGASVVSQGISVNAYASTPYNVAVGGTDFSDTYSGTNATYWTATNTPTGRSAKSYVPEIPWNDSCASFVLADLFGFAQTYGAGGFCNDPTNGGFYQTNLGGSGGPSACATGAGVTCAGYAKPSWQSGVFGIPNDGVRDLPDVSLFSAHGLWSHFYVYCFTDDSNLGNSCASPPDPNSGSWNGGSGTAVPTAIMAGIQALVNQKAGGPQGNPNYRLYQLAAKEYGVSGSSSCNSSNGKTAGSSCIFYDVTLGDNDAPCVGTINCYTPDGAIGVLSTSNNSYAPAFKATTGWDFSTGIGTINVSNLVTNWAVKSVTATHDFNGDGKSDIAWRDTGGNTAVWLMNGATVSLIRGVRRGAHRLVDRRDSATSTATASTTCSGVTAAAIRRCGSMNGTAGRIVGRPRQYSHRLVGRRNRRTSTATARATFSGATRSGNSAIWLMNGAARLVSLRVSARCLPPGRSSEPETSTATARPTCSGVTTAAIRRFGS